MFSFACRTCKREPFPRDYFAVVITSNEPSAGEQSGAPARMRGAIVLLSPHCHELVNGHEAGPVASSRAEQWCLPVKRALTGLRRQKEMERMGRVWCGYKESDGGVGLRSYIWCCRGHFVTIVLLPCANTSPHKKMQFVV